MTQVMVTNDRNRQRIARIVLAYPFAMLVVGMGLNAFAFGFDPAIVALPSGATLGALIIAAILVAANHAWLMTATELTRLKYRLYATPEEWVASGTNPQHASEEGLREIARCHNAHRNATENTVLFVLLAGIFVLISPPDLAAQVWLIGFAVARLGYTYAYLTGRDGVRSIFMSISLVAMFAMAGYLAVSLLV
jgi:uncharacterized MAPEG superfamily protein